MQVAHSGGDIKKQEERFRESEAGKENVCDVSATACRHGDWILLGLSRSIRFSTHRMGGGGICLWALILH